MCIFFSIHLSCPQESDSFLNHGVKYVHTILREQIYTPDPNEKSIESDMNLVRVVMLIMESTDTYPEKNPASKTNFKSASLREEGNRMFKKKRASSADYVQAWLKYCESIAHAPRASLELVQAFANRSAVLFYLSKYSECIQDVDRVLGLEHPASLRSKLLMRKLKCLIFLKRGEARRTLSTAQGWMSQGRVSASRQDKEHFQRELEQAVEKSLAEPEARAPVVERTLDAALAELADGEISDSLSLSYDAKKRWGCAVAKRSIEPGVILAKLRPYSAALHYKNVYSHCSECFVEAWTSVACEHCVYALYCSLECRARAWDRYHELECKVRSLWLITNDDDTPLLNLRTICQAVKECGGSLQKLWNKLDDVHHLQGPLVCRRGEPHYSRISLLILGALILAPSIF